MKFLAAATLAGVLALGAGAANATTYLINVDGCSGAGCGSTSYGNVTVTGDGSTQLTFDIDLTGNNYFNAANTPHFAVFFDLNGDTGSATLGGLAAPFGANGDETAGTNNTGPFGDFEYTVNWIGPPVNNGTLPGAGVQALDFTVTSTHTLTLGSGLQNGTTTPPIFLVVDIAGYNSSNQLINTGRVGATLTAVPEPATWGLMILGFGGVGAMMRRRRMAIA
jgi:hypothetical protein